MKNTLFAVLALTFLCALNSRLSTAFAQGTAFTYQGQLQNSGSPASGSYDLQFTLYTTNFTGSAIAGPVTNSAAAVTNGLFTTLINFGAGAFTGTSNWLDIAVRTNGAATFTELTPRQQLTPTPYAIYSANAGSASTATTAGSASSVAATNVSGTLGLGQLPSAVLTNNATGVTVTGTFTGNGGGLTNFPAWQLAGNTGTTNGNYLGTADNSPLEIRVGGVRAIWINPSNGGPNIVFGPVQNVISNTTANASILGGSNNTIAAVSSYSSIGGGANNLIQSYADHAFIGGGGANLIQSSSGNPNPYSSIVGGFENNITLGDFYSFLGGGDLNYIEAPWCVLVGGNQSYIEANASYSFIGGGELNGIGTGAAAATLVGGYNNTIGRVQDKIIH